VPQGLVSTAHLVFASMENLQIHGHNCITNPEKTKLSRWTKTWHVKSMVSTVYWHMTQVAGSIFSKTCSAHRGIWNKPY